MLRLPKLIVLDLETALTTGQPSVEFYRPDFRIVSCAVTWDCQGTLKSIYLTGEPKVKRLLRRISNYQIPTVVHNLSFEYGVLKARFPELEFNWHADTMRLTQNADNGGKSSKKEEQSIDEELDPEPIAGLGLTKCIQRWLPSTYHNHKEPFHSYIREQGIKKGKEGSNLHLLPSTMFKAYNVSDTENTYRLHTRLTEHLSNHDWSLDHYLYSGVSKLISDSRHRGVAVDRDLLNESIKTLKADLEFIRLEFLSQFRNEIAEVVLDKISVAKASYKTEKGRNNLKIEDYEFNINSSKDKEALFVGKLRIVPKFTTDTGKPSFSKQFLKQWGEGGKLLHQRGTLNQCLTQCETLLEKSEYDGRWHIDLMAAGTTTGRFKGTGGLNIQAMARKEPLLMKAIKPDPGNIFVSVDLSAGEPTITTQFSKDPYYHAATFGMVGREPYFDDRNVLLIDDIYLMGMSVSPMGKERILRAFYEEKFDGLSFIEMWAKDPVAIQKKFLKTEREFHKMLILAMTYSMGPKHMCEAAHKAGYELSMKDARAFFKAYWSLFKDVKKLGDTLESQFKQKGFLTNIFGYRLLPNPSYKSLNYFIQSSVSGLINALCLKFFTICKDAKFVTVIHDEIIFEVSKERLDESKTLFFKALDSLNEDLGWGVRVRCGWVEGNDLYEAK